MPWSGLDDRIHDTRAHRRIHDRCRRIGPHPPGIGAAIAFPYPLVILRRDQRQDIFTIDQGKEARFLPLQEGLDDKLGPRAAKLTAQNVVDRRFRLGNGFSDDHPLASSQTIGFDNDGRTGVANECLGRRGLGKAAIGRSGNAWEAGRLE